MTFPIAQFVDLLSQDQCALLIAGAEAEGFRPARHRAAGRLNEETFMENSALAAYVTRRIEREFCVLEVDELFEIYRYSEQQRIDLHVDRRRRLFRHESNATLLIYLNDDFLGGCTRFPSVDAEIAPLRGKGILFPCDLPHSAEPVLAGLKFVARSVVAIRCGPDGPPR